MKKVLLSLLLILPLGTIIWANLDLNTPSTHEKADKVVVFKAKRILQLIKDNKVIFQCRVSLGDAPLGHKEKEGDEKTPEGNYSLDWRKKSLFHKAIHISYPNKTDMENANRKGVSPGGVIMIHGIKNNLEWIGKLHLLDDWTNGCIAVTNREMDIIWNQIENNTPIEIKK